MVAEAVFEGAIPPEGVGDLLGGLEEIGATGVFDPNLDGQKLTFRSGLHRAIITQGAGCHSGYR